ncbi:histone H1-like [Microplitis mediator]|uniref:histone H1-like n=1 Tax=Microplitis mediator TaxID=375433 RepID=UPI0025530CA5|nr:histone H1-like [Microplitis mediator]
MTETAVSPAPAVEEKIVAKSDSPKKAVKAKKPSAKPTHPSTADMVTAAIKSLGERGGSSLQAIKKYIAATYKVDAEKQAQFIKKFLKAAVTKGTLVQTKGKGASGSFKLPVTKSASKPKVAGEKKAAAKKPAAKKPATKKATEAKTSVKKATAPKKAVAKKPTAAKKPAKAPAKPKAAAPKAKKAVKGPTAKPKSPKPKKVAAPKAAKAPARKAPTVRK